MIISGCDNINTHETNALKPIVTTNPVKHDTDDPAIWINPEEPIKSLIIGTDKDVNGGLFVFDLDGKILPEKTVSLKQPNNVDVEYGLLIGNVSTDIARQIQNRMNYILMFLMSTSK
jgi:3-phytase